jgi:hypothetical protein
MTLPLPDRQDLRQLLTQLDAIHAQLASRRDRVMAVLPEVQYRDREGKLRIYTSLCANLTAQLGQYMRLRRLVILSYLEELRTRAEEGHDCRQCKGHCDLQHAQHLAEIQDAHASLRELLEHLHPFSLALPATSLAGTELLRDFRAAMLKLEEALGEMLFIEESALVPLIRELQRKIHAHE